MTDLREVPPGAEIPGVDRATEPENRSYGEALRAGLSSEAERIALAHLREGMSVASLYEEVLSPAMVEVGVLWAAGEMTVADEHLASALNLKVMSAAYVAALPSRPHPSQGRVLLAGVEGDSHSVGIRMAGDVIELAGFDLEYMGADVHVESLLDAVTRYRPEAVLLGLPSEAAGPAAAPTIAALRRCFPSMPLLCGGRESGCGASEVEKAAFLIHLSDQLRTLVSRDRDPDPRRRSKNRSPVSRPPRPEPSAEDRMLEVAADAAEAARAYARAGEEFRRLAFEDVLTGIANRRALEDRIEAYVASGKPAVLVLIDLDDFKEINDRSGHLVGDHVLRKVATLLRSVAGPEDLVARMGGDEFAVLIDGEDPEEGVRLGRDFGRLLGGLSGVEGVAATCGVSRLDGDRAAALVEADRALYRGKSLGGDTVT